MTQRGWLVAGACALAAAAPLAAFEATQAPGAAPRAAPASRLAVTSRARLAAKHARPRAFRSCAALVRYARAHFAVTHGIPGPPLRPVSEPATLAAPGAQAAPAPAATAQPTGTSGASTPSFSTTNVQEPGVDEPDIVKTNGSTIFTVSQGTLYAIAANAGTPKLEGSLALGPGGYNAQLLLRGTRLIVILGGAPGPVPLGAAGPALPARTPASSRPIAVAPPGVPPYPSPYYYRASTTVDEVDISEPAAMHVTRTMTVDGSFVDARQNGGTARLVIASAPRAIATAGVRAQAAGWIPQRRFHSLLTGRRYKRPVAGCTAVARPAQFSGLGTVTILTLNLDRGLWTAGSDALMADAQVVYGSAQSLYIATQKWLSPQTGPAQPQAQATAIDRFDASDPNQTPFVASGEVPGYLLNQFSLSEYKGYLRVATTSAPIWWPGFAPQQQSQSYVTVLATQGAALVPVGQVAGLGVGQKIYSVRFVDDAGYVVTFRQIDPLYTLDLSSPTAPKVAGQLELEGYSSYLHPLGGGLLLGVGQSVGVNEPAGAQLELFDVSSPAAPKLLARTGLGSGSSTSVQYDHHAFLSWPPTKLALLPLQIYTPCAVAPAPAPSPGATSGSPPPAQPACTPAAPFNGAIGYAIDRSGISEVGRITHDAINGSQPAIARSLVIGADVFTISYAGVLSSRLDTLARVAFAAFPTPQPTPQPGASAR